MHVNQLPTPSDTATSTPSERGGRTLPRSAIAKAIDAGHWEKARFVSAHVMESFANQSPHHRELCVALCKAAREGDEQTFMTKGNQLRKKLITPSKALETVDEETHSFVAAAACLTAAQHFYKTCEHREKWQLAAAAASQQAMHKSLSFGNLSRMRAFCASPVEPVPEAIRDQWLREPALGL